MSFESGLAFFITIFIFVITPGPGVFAIISRAINYGAKGCILLILGLILGDIIYLVSACFGLSAIVAEYNTAFLFIKIFGSLYLIYLAYKIVTSDVIIPTKQNNKTKILFAQGFLISISNPKVIIFYIAFLPTFVDLNNLSNIDILTISIICSSALFLGAFGIACSTSYTRKFFKSKESLGKLNLLSGCLIFIAGICLFYSSFA